MFTSVSTSRVSSLSVSNVRAFARPAVAQQPAQPQQPASGSRLERSWWNNIDTYISETRWVGKVLLNAFFCTLNLKKIIKKIKMTLTECGEAWSIPPTSDVGESWVRISSFRLVVNAVRTKIHVHDSWISCLTIERCRYCIGVSKPDWSLPLPRCKGNK